MIEYIEKKGAIPTRIGEARDSFPGGKMVTIKQPWDGKEVPGVNIGVKFDFDQDNWYTANITQADVDKYLKEGKPVDIKTWSKESNGKTYHNFAIIYQKKTDPSKLIEELVNPLIQKVERQGKQIISLYSDIKTIKAWITKKDTTTMFDDDAKDVHPDEYKALFGEENDGVPPLDSYNESDWQGEEM